jgi:Methyltransferase domain
MLESLRPERAVRIIRQQGLRRVGRLGLLLGRSAVMALADRRRERPFGVNTRGAVELDDLAVDSQRRTLGHAYTATPNLLVETLLSNLPADLTAFSFVDFGSGKGRVLLAASHHPFRQVVGVEFSPELHQIAQDNIRRYISLTRRCQDVRSVCADAAAYELPHGDCVLFFNNPFAEPVFDQVLDNVRAAYERSRPKLYVLYHQLAGELEDDRTDNIAALRRVRFLRERQVRYPSVITRFLLGSHELHVFESATEPPTHPARGPAGR